MAMTSETRCAPTMFANEMPCHGERCEASESRCISKVFARMSEQTAGRRLSDELSRDGDSITVRELIGHAARFADMIERCDELIQGKRSAWMHVRTNSDQVLEVRISDPVRERRQLTTGCDICSVRFISRGPGFRWRPRMTTCSTMAIERQWPKVWPGWLGDFPD